MKCAQLQFDLALSPDGSDIKTSEHLASCPVCRQRDSEYREIRTSLRQLARPELASAFKNSLRAAVRYESLSERRSWWNISRVHREWLRMQVMPLAVGSLATLLVGFSFISVMFSGLPKASAGASYDSVVGSSVALASNLGPDRDASISPLQFAQTRAGFASESPSLNPHGALAALTRSLVKNGSKGDEVVVVADVLSNGLAHISEVVEPSSDKRAIEQLKRALETDPAYAAFVPAKLENRPESVRVILKFQSVDVDTDTRRGKRR